MCQSVKYFLLLSFIHIAAANAQTGNSALGGMTGFLNGMNQGLLQSQQQENEWNALENQRLQILNESRALDFQIQQLKEQNQRELDALHKAVLDAQRAATDPHLLPLAPANGGLKLEVQTQILSTLGQALELDKGASSRVWNLSDASGIVSVSAAKKNQYGSLCREFELTLSDGSGRKLMKSAACRDKNGWKWL